jgi:glycogen debranching enzyme
MEPALPTPAPGAGSAVVDPAEQHGGGLQPMLHDLVASLAAPTQAWSGSDGQIRAAGAQGAYHGDVRTLSEAVLRVGGEEPEPVAATVVAAGEVAFVGLARHLGDRVPDPTVRVDRVRRVSPGVVTETVTVTSSARTAVTAQVELDVAADLASMDAVKVGTETAPVAPELTGSPAALRWQGDGVTAELTAAGPGARLDAIVEPGTSGRRRTGGVVRWDVRLPAPGEVRLEWRLRARDERAVVTAPETPAPWQVEGSRLVVRADDSRLAPWLDRSLDDLAALRMVSTDYPGQPFLAAGAPWFFTLFGRDSLWAARMLLPLGTELAASTLRVLAARQGRVVDSRSAEAPGKILHEVRRAELDLGGSGFSLPPVYFGTVDATPLWVCLLHDAWRWGMDAEDVEALLPHLEAALAWMVEHGDADGDGFLEYVDDSGRGLTNQGWKDSGDSVQWRDGALAEAPIALCEVQGYAYEAAMSGAALLDGFGRPGADRWRDWAQRLASRFRSTFWAEDADGPYPVIALDAAKRRVDTLTSNAGHLLGTGLLDDTESAVVAARMAAADMDSGFGLRTLSSKAGGFGPLSYHGGSVWPHDTAIVLRGMAAAGHTREAAGLVEGLLAAASAFGNRLPELFAGDARRDLPVPVPYPAACRPQAWAAASAVVVLDAVLGVRPDVPAGSSAIAPMSPSPVGAVSCAGLRLGGGALTVTTDRDGRLTRAESMAGVPLRIP